jgi:hypothetical protein
MDNLKERRMFTRLAIAIIATTIKYQSIDDDDVVNVVLIGGFIF